MEKKKSTKRVFIGIKLTDELAKACALLQQELADLPARFIRPEDMHVTMLPPWNMAEQSVVEPLLREVASEAQPFTLTLKKLEYGPTRSRPRLAWIECGIVEELVLLQEALTDRFEVEGIRRPFRPHVTVARFKKEHRKKLKNRPIEKQLSLAMEVRTLELFESVHRGGVGYRVLLSLPFSRR